MTESITVLRILIRGGLATLWPWLILAISFGVNLAVYAVAGDNPGIVRQSGGILSLYLTAIAAYQQSWSQVLPFTLGMSGTRRGFVTGMGLFVLAQAIVTGVLLTTLGAVESRTDGWGVEMRFFRTPILDDLAVPGRFAVLTAAMLALSGLGAILGAVLVRWGSTGMWWLLVGLGLLIGVLTVGIAAGGGLVAVLGGLAARPWQQLWLGLPLGITALAGTATWLIARRVAIR